MDDLLKYLSAENGAALATALIVAWAMTGLKKATGLKPGTQAFLKQLLALGTSSIAAAIMGLATWALTGVPWAWGAWLVALIKVFFGSTLAHTFIPQLRSLASKSPGYPQEKPVG